MREIKFRVYDKVNKCFISDMSNFWINPSFTAMMEWRPEFDGQMTFDLNDSLIFQQYTGLKDKNGVEIYEGDLLVGHNLPIGETPAEVVFSDAFGGWTLDGKFCGGYMCGTSQRANYTSYEVVGNIFEGVDK